MAGVVRVFDVSLPSASYVPIRQIADPVPSFRGGLSVTMGDVNGDRVPDIITGAGAQGSSWVRVYDGSSGARLNSFQAFPAKALNPQAPVRVLARDIDGDGKAEVLAAQGTGGKSNYQVRRYKPLNGSLVDAFFATSPDFSGGGLYLG
jgi:hypothetical protein